MKACTVCGVSKGFGEFYLDRGAPRASCKECVKRKANAAYWRDHAASREAALRRYRNNPAVAKSANDRWVRKNPDRARAIWRACTARRRTRCPAWADAAAIRAFYEIAARVSRCTGIEFEVDHIEPLQGKHSSGLHVPWNLRVIPMRANRVKSNRLMSRDSQTF